MIIVLALLALAWLTTFAAWLTAWRYVLRFRVAQEIASEFALVVDEQNETMLTMMRGNRDLALGVLAAHEQGLDIEEGLRLLASDLNDKLAQIEEHII